MSSVSIDCGIEAWIRREAVGTAAEDEVKYFCVMFDSQPAYLIAKETYHALRRYGTSDDR